MQTINIITRCTRPNNLVKVKESIFRDSSLEIKSNLKINWHILFDTAPLKDIDAELLSSISSENTKIHFINSGDGGLLYPQSSELIKTFDPNSWFYFLDDDNLLHDDFYNYINASEMLDSKDHLIHVVSQKVSGKDFTGLDVREATANNTGFQKTDIAQVIVKSKLINDYTFGKSYAADGHFIQAVLNDHPEYFRYHDVILSHYNYLEKQASPKLPKVLYIGEGTPDLKSKKWLSYESDDLDVEYLEDDQYIRSTVASFKPDIILTRGEHWSEFRNVSNMPMQFRRKWIHVNVDKNGIEDVEHIGEYAYTCSMGAMLAPDNLDDQSLISFFTPIYNTKEKLWTTYKSVAAQTYDNWEWILMNDSTDGGKTLKIAEEIAKNDPRVKVYDFREKSGGCIGEVKWRACSMARGYIVAELDHDDLLANTCAQDLHDAATAHPECGFFFGDTAEIFENGKPHTYGPDGSFGLGYGNYREEKYMDLDLVVCNQHNINPKTIRHIVGVPNHIRAWRRSTYFEVGGHNRNLTVADDYELVIRTFLNTIMCKIPKLSYIQLIYNNAGGRNTHDLSRDDIQRRTRTIASHYNEAIKARFEELGVHDWAYEENPDYPINSKSRFGEDEGAVNITYTKKHENIQA